MKSLSRSALLITLLSLSGCDAFYNEETLYLKEKTDPTCYRYVYSYNDNKKLIQSKQYFGERLSSTVDFQYANGNLTHIEQRVPEADLLSIVDLVYNTDKLRIKETRTVITSTSEYVVVSTFSYYPDRYLKSKTFYSIENGDTLKSNTSRFYEWKNGNLIKVFNRINHQGVEFTPTINEYIYDNNRNPYNQDLGFNYISGEGDETYFSKNNLIAIHSYTNPDGTTDKIEFNFKYNKDKYPTESTTQSPYYSHAPLYYKY